MENMWEEEVPDERINFDISLEDFSVSSQPWYTFKSGNEANTLEVQPTGDIAALLRQVGVDVDPENVEIVQVGGDLPERNREQTVQIVDEQYEDDIEGHLNYMDYYEALEKEKDRPQSNEQVRGVLF